MTDLITQKELKEILHYDPDTGVFTWRKSRNKSVHVGDVAGCITNDGYLAIGINKKIFPGQRLAWFYMMGNWPKEQIDHINHDRADNRWSNIREVSGTENHRNRAISNRNTSGFVGVCWDKKNNRWMASIKIKGKSITLGRFKNKIHAIECRKKANDKYGFHENHGK